MASKREAQSGRSPFIAADQTAPPPPGGAMLGRPVLQGRTAPDQQV